MRKLFAIIAVLALAMAISAPALAGGCHGRARAVGYAVCTVENCAALGLHVHDGVVYCAHFSGDGHDYHAYCAYDNCTLAGYHMHGGGHSQRSGGHH